MQHTRILVAPGPAAFQQALQQCRAQGAAQVVAPLAPVQAGAGEAPAPLPRNKEMTIYAVGLGAVAVILRVSIVGFSTFANVSGGGPSLLLRTFAAAVIAAMIAGFIAHPFVSDEPSAERLPRQSD